MMLDLHVEKQLGAFRLHVGFQTQSSRLGVFGPSGSGKSSLVHLLAGLQSPDRGRITLNAEVLFCHRDGIALPPEQRRIAVVFQQGHLFPHLSVRRNLLYGYRRTPAALRRIDPDALIEVLQLGDLLQRGVNTLSGGERQRVALGRAVLSSPRMLIMDEPLCALDEGLKYRIIPCLRSVFETFSLPFLFISHSLKEMRLMADEVVVLDGGEVAQQTDPEALARGPLTRTPGYVNLLHLEKIGMRDGMVLFRWGKRELCLPSGACSDGTVFELPSCDIVLFKRHPEAISARNLIPCRVSALHRENGHLAAELDCGGERLLCHIVHKAAEDLAIRPGVDLFAAIKASSFRIVC